jgi:CBS domain containing-hemolysin-like protein
LESASVWSDLVGIGSVLVLILANGFFVAAEFSLVAVRPSRVEELIGHGRANAQALQRAIQKLDANLAATQLGITISSLALGWIGEPALAHLIEPLFASLPGWLGSAGTHATAVALAFALITALHIVFGELAPKSLALQRSEGTALWVVRPLGLFLFLLRPAILFLNGLGNAVLRLFSLKPGATEQTLHSPDELKLLVAASQEGGLLHEAQQEVVDRALTIGDRPVADIMTPRIAVEWIDANDPPQVQLQSLRESHYGHVLLARGSVDEIIGLVSKEELLHRVLDGEPVRIEAALRQPAIVHESARIFRILDMFKKAPVRMVVVVDEYGALAGIVTKSDILRAFAGDLPDVEGEEPDIVARPDGVLVFDGMTPVHEAFVRLDLKEEPDADFHTIAGFALSRLRHLPAPGESFDDQGWHFQVLEMDGRRIAKLSAVPLANGNSEIAE